MKETKLRRKRKLMKISSNDLTELFRMNMSEKIWRNTTKYDKFFVCTFAGRRNEELLGNTL